MKKELLCVVCKKKASISPSYTSAVYCQEHFRALIEKRVRKDLRISKAINVKLPYFFEEDYSPLSTLTKDLLSSIFEGRLLLSDNRELPLSQHIFPFCLEQYVSDQFTAFLDAHPLGKEGVYPLKSIALEDVKYLVSNEIVFTSDTNDLLFALEKKQSGSAFAMANVFEFLREKGK